MATWKEKINEAFEKTGDSWANVEQSTLSEENMSDEFGGAFAIWTKDYVYFPVCYDHLEWIGRVARNPNGLPTEPQGA